ncbi:MAG: RNA polymerase sigma factor [bacterium]|nr:RNA polymerase sigma factor [bacterium]
MALTKTIERSYQRKMERRSPVRVFTGAHEQYRDSLSSHAYFKVSDQSTSEDLVQDTFMKAWAYMQKRGRIDVMKAFLYHILNNLIVDEYRKRKTTSLDSLMEKGFDPSSDPTDKLFSTLDSRGVLHLIEKLPSIYQNVIHMRYVQDLSLKEISQITGESKNTIAVRMHRGLQKLRKLHDSSQSRVV